MRVKCDVVCVGVVEGEIILNMKADHLLGIEHKFRKLLGADAKLEATDVLYTVGGAGYLAAIACARLGLRTAVHAQIGSDSLGSEARQSLRTEGVLLDFLMASPRFATSLRTTLRSANDERVQIEYSGRAQDYDKKSFVLPDGHEIKALYITALGGDIGLLKRLISWARKQGIYVALKPGLAEIVQARRVLKLFAQADMVFFERNEAELLTHQTDPEATLRALRTSGLKSVVLYQEDQMAWAIHDGFLYTARKKRSPKPISSTGMQDAFCASTLACYLRHKSIDRAVGFGLLAAGSVGTFVGSDAGLLRGFSERTRKVDKKFL